MTNRGRKPPMQFAALGRNNQRDFGWFQGISGPADATTTMLFDGGPSPTRLVAVQVKD